MERLSRKRAMWILLAVYWPLLFVASHLPLPRVVHEAQVSDKTLHFVAYAVLVFLLWAAIRPYEPVRWNRPAVWWLLLFVVWYGAMDEWLQGFVRGRSVDVRDFYADLAATLTCLGLLSVLPFWRAFVCLVAAAVFLLSACSERDLSTLLPWAEFLLQFGGYAFFTLVWAAGRHRLASAAPDSPVRRPAMAWWQTFSAPLALWVLTKVGAWWRDKPLSAWAMGCGLLGMALGGLLAAWLTAGRRAGRADRRSAATARS